ncbi:ABC transporter ATP-binding protein [Nocardioides ganghwensis]|uniref:ABC transporter ATP-binding protein n=1 Tax=Nocardioides ganghwensis TaxID=252230 RepID=A0A4Q2SF41_9ACTN|nr:ABC transporter ATP-binding protein [Nocardioides ganghwensis]MBD3947084.1 ABC transporter ATP-binding protein [Nocardioides ganghwensis]RYC01988.1 ABC transporter ATP-binding protein [Nocardioides ganghwensis]
MGEEAEPRGTTTLDGFRVLWVGVKREPKVFTVATLGAVLFGVLTVADAWVLGWSTEHVLIPAFDNGEIGTDMLVWVFALFMAVAILRAVGIVARRLGGGIMYYRMQSHTRRAVTRQYLSLPMEWHQRHPTGQLLSNAYSDVEAAWSPIMPLPMALGTVVMMVIAVVQMFVADTVLALVGLLVFPAVVVANLLYQHYSSPLMTRAQGLRAEVSEIAHESFDGAMVVKTLGRETEETDRFGAKARELRDVNIRAGRIRAVFDPALASLPGLGVLVVLAVGVSRVTSGATDAGDVVTVAYLLTIVSFPIRAIGWLLGEFPRSVVGYRRAKAVLDAQGSMEWGDAELPRTDEGALLEVEDLHYSYDADAPLLRGVDFDVRPGRTVALVGATASGKSTLTSLLTRLVDPDSGTVRVDGRDVTRLRKGELSRSVSLVPQTAFMFDDTVRDNVTLGADVSDEEVWAALRTAQADGFVAALPGGLDSLLGERGTSLSGGQRQRLSLARALVRRPRLLILDDATSAVDPEVEARILASLRDDVDGSAASLVVVAYRKATISLADEVVHLDDGRIVGRGTHAELLATSPAYAQLVNAYEVDAATPVADAEGTKR